MKNPKKRLHDEALPNPVLGSDMYSALAPRTSVIGAGGALTTASMLQGMSKILLPEARTETPTGARDPGVFVSSEAALSNGPPPDPGFLPLSNEFQPSIGVYLLPAATGAGKTVLTLGLVAWCNARGIPASYVPCFEPRVEPVQAGSRVLFADPKKFLANMLLDIPGGSKKLVVYDSVSLPIEAFSINYPSQPTYAGGMQPSSRAFCEAGNRAAVQKQAVIIFIINTQMVPYAANLGGSVEGVINVQDVGNFTYSDRSPLSGREPKPIQVPLPFVNAALAAMGLGDYKQRTTRRYTRSFSGI